jgi:hypothetical protein
MQNDYDKKLEQAKLARMQGIRLTRPESINAPKRNRIEEAMQGKAPLYKEPSTSFIPPIPSRRVEEKPVEVPKADAKPAKVKKVGTYGGFLKKFFLGLGIIVLLTIVSVGGKSVFKTFTTSKTLAPKDVVTKVGKLVELPPGEAPTVATVSDLAPLKSQEFFKDAQIGDKVLIFGAAKKAILYRPSTDKIIQVAPLNK